MKFRSASQMPEKSTLPSAVRGAGASAEAVPGTSLCWAVAPSNATSATAIPPAATIGRVTRGLTGPPFVCGCACRHHLTRRSAERSGILPAGSAARDIANEDDLPDRPTIDMFEAIVVGLWPVLRRANGDRGGRPQLPDARRSRRPGSTTPRGTPRVFRNHSARGKVVHGVATSQLESVSRYVIRRRILLVSGSSS